MTSNRYSWIIRTGIGLFLILWIAYVPPAYDLTPRLTKLVQEPLQEIIAALVILALLLVTYCWWAILAAVLFVWAVRRVTQKRNNMSTRTFLTGIATLFLAMGTAHATEKGDTLPPTEFDRPYTGELEIVRVPNLREVEAICRKTGIYACSGLLANGARCIVFILPDKQLKASGKNAIAFMSRHELGHCNGWPGNHKNGRRVDKEFRDGHIAMPTMPAVIRELPASPPVVCVTPDWKQEPCASRAAMMSKLSEASTSMTNQRLNTETEEGLRRWCSEHPKTVASECEIEK